MQQQPYMPSRKGSFIAYIICTVASLFYIYDFIVRVMPSAMTKELMLSFDIKAAGLGILASLFFYGYAFMQIPAGALFDKYSSRILLSLMTLIAALATLLFASSNIYYVAAIARIITGTACAFAFVGALYVGAMWFPSRHFATYAGSVQLLGCVGAIVGQGPIAALTLRHGWQKTTIYISVLGIIFAILMFLVIRTKTKAKQSILENEKFKFFSFEIFQIKQIWPIALFGFMVWAPIVVFATLWGVPFFEAILKVSKVQSASMMSIIWIGVAVGGPIIGFWSISIKNRRLPGIVATLIGLISSTLIVYFANHLSQFIIYISLFLFGTAASAQVVSFGLVSDIFTKRVIGTAIGFTNMAVILSGIIFQPLVGFILDWHGHTADIDNSPVYSVHAYQIALTILPICFLIAFLTIWLFIRETRCEKQY